MKKFLFIFIILLSTRIVEAQTRPEIKNLVFEGAGIRGIAYCGAIQELEAKNMMGNIEKVGGTSSGAVVAMMLSLGYSGRDIEGLITKTKFKKLNDGGFFFIGGINRIKKYFGWYKGKKAEKWLGKIIAEKTGNADITFKELYEKGLNDLYVTGTSLTKQKPVIFCRETYPNMKVLDAVRISISIPLYFEPVFIDSNGRVVYHPKQKQGLDVFVDGGIVENFPIHIFDTATPDLNTIGFRMDHDAQIESDKLDRTLAEMEVGNLNEYFRAFYSIVIENLNRQRLTDIDWQRTVSISDGNVQPRVRKVLTKEINILIENGRKAVRNRFN
ncbi:MAG TPA: patatin-like phospholipase family protein [Chitinophagaceae bacterium]|nr:patatin-like phospholipase family protein [Chitinophagaceae bacterium]